MSRIAIPPVESATGATAALYDQIRKSVGGSLPNLYAALGHLAPSGLSAVLNAEGVLSSGSLDKPDLETIKLSVSAETGCDYCEAAHSLLGKMAGLSPGALRAIRTDATTGEAKRDALLRFVRLILRTHGTLDEKEVAAIRAAGYSDTQLADISLAIALTIYTNTFNRINDTAVDFPPVR